MNITREEPLLVALKDRVKQAKSKKVTSPSNILKSNLLKAYLYWPVQVVNTTYDYLTFQLNLEAKFCIILQPEAQLKP